MLFVKGSQMAGFWRYLLFCYNMLMDELYKIYNQFLSNFPPSIHPLVSIVLAILLIYGIIKVIQKDFVYIILLVVLLPASLPILKNIWQSLANIITFLLAKK